MNWECWDEDERRICPALYLFRKLFILNVTISSDRVGNESIAVSQQFYLVFFVLFVCLIYMV